MGDYREYGTNLFVEMHSESRRGNKHSLWRGKFLLDLRKTFFKTRLGKHQGKLLRGCVQTVSPSDLSGLTGVTKNKIL